MRFIFILLIMYSSFVYSQNTEKKATYSGVKVTGFGQVSLQPIEYLLDVVIEERGASAIKVLQSTEYKLSLLQQFVNKFSDSIQLNTLSSMLVKVNYPKLNNSINDVEFLTRLPNKLPAKINTKLSGSLTQSSGKAAIVQVSQAIVISVSDIRTYQRVIDQLIKIGINDIQAINMSQAQYQKLYSLALKKALDDAKNKAYNMAKQLNISLAEIVTVKEMNVKKNHFKASKDKLKHLLNNEQATGQYWINAQVKVIFAIKPQ